MRFRQISLKKCWQKSLRGIYGTISSAPACPHIGGLGFWGPPERPLTPLSETEAPLDTWSFFGFHVLPINAAFSTNVSHRVKLERVRTLHTSRDALVGSAANYLKPLFAWPSWNNLEKERNKKLALQSLKKKNKSPKHFKLLQIPKLVKIPFRNTKQVTKIQLLKLRESIHLF